MNRLIAFGDSWTAGNGVELDESFKEVRMPDHFIYSLRSQNSWPRYLAEKLDRLVVNMGLAGLNNAQLILQLEQYQSYFLPNDLIIIMWSFPYRHIGVPHQNGFPDYSSTPINKIINKAERLLQNYNYFFVNAFYPYYKNEPDLKPIDTNNWINIDNSAATILLDYELRYPESSVWEYGYKKVIEGNGKGNYNIDLGEYHPNNFGYKVIANWLYLELQKD